MRKMLVFAVLTGCVMAFICLRAQAAQDTVLDNKIQQLITQLGDADWNKRAAATEELKKIGKPALPKLKEATNSKNEEVASRARALIRFIEAATAAESAPAPDIGTGGGNMPQMQQQMLGQGMGGMGNVPRAYFGVQLDPFSSPVKIIRVVTGGPADQAGLQAEDLLLEIASRKVQSAQDAMQQFAKFKPGDNVAMKIQRGNQKLTINVTAGDRAQAGMGGMGGMGGMQGMMNNPQVQQMAQQMMSNPQFMQMVRQMMNNPQFMQMAQQMMAGGGQGAGGMQQMMSNPQFQQMARQMMNDPQFMQMAQQMMGGGMGGMAGQQPQLTETPQTPKATVDLLDSFGAKLSEVPGGLRVTELRAGTPAVKCGLMVGDIVNKVDGREVSNIADAREMLGNLPPRRQIQLEATRRGETITLTVKP